MDLHNIVKTTFELEKGLLIKFRKKLLEEDKTLKEVLVEFIKKYVSKEG